MLRNGFEACDGELLLELAVREEVDENGEADLRVTSRLVGWNETYFKYSKQIKLETYRPFHQLKAFCFALKITSQFGC